MRETRRCPLFSQVQVRRTSPHTGREHEFTRLRCPEWINVIAFTPLDKGGEVLAVEQYRHGLDRPTLEIPGGVCDGKEDPETAARKELLEETGHVPGAWISLGSCAPNPAIQDNRCHFFLALDCTPARALELDPAEELRVWAFPWLEWERKLRNGDVDHALVLAAFLRLRFWEGWPDLKRRLETP